MSWTGFYLFHLINWSWNKSDDDGYQILHFNSSSKGSCIICIVLLKLFLRVIHQSVIVISTSVFVINYCAVKISINDCSLIVDCKIKKKIRTMYRIAALINWSTSQQKLFWVLWRRLALLQPFYVPVLYMHILLFSISWVCVVQFWEYECVRTVLKDSLIKSTKFKSCKDYMKGKTVVNVIDRQCRETNI